MKKATIASIVLALLVVANAAAATNRVPIMKRKGERKGALKEFLKDRKKRDNSECAVVTCIAEGDTCPDEYDNTKACNDGMECVDGKCGIFIEGGPCGEYGKCSNNFKGDSDMYCNSSERKCRKQKGEGEACTSDIECDSDFICNTKDDETPGVCVKRPTKAGDDCSFDYGQCPGNLKCYKKFCTELPTTVGAECDPYDLPCVGDNLTCKYGDYKCVALHKEDEACSGGMCAAGLYCNDEGKCVARRGIGEECTSSSKCAEGLYCNDEDKCANYPVAGEECLNGYTKCADGYGCDESTNKCFEYPGFGEECYGYKCGPELACVEDYVFKKRICRSTDRKEGSYCYDDTQCNEGLLCDDERNKCVVGECQSVFDCPTGKGCAGYKCVDFMSVADGGECNNNDDFGSFACKEGSGCVPDNTSNTGYKCMKITTTLEDEITCTEDDDSNCTADSYCECNAINGMMQCIPYIANNKKTVGYYKKIWEYKDSDIEKAKAYYITLYSMLFPHSIYFHCLTPVPLPEPIPDGSSDRKPLAFSLVLLIVGLIKAFF